MEWKNAELEQDWNSHSWLPRIPDRSFVITDYGAVGDGMTDNTEAFKLTIEACYRGGGGKVIIPAGIWRTGPISLRSRICLHSELGAVVSFSTNFTDYPLIQTSFEGQLAYRCQAPLDGEELEDVAITGSGIFDGNGASWRPVKRNKLAAKDWLELLQSGGIVDAAGETWWPSEAAMNGRALVEQLQADKQRDSSLYEAARDYLRPVLLSLRNCRRVLLDGGTFQNSASWCLHPWACEGVTIRGVTVRNPWYAQNGDGLDIDSCRYVRIENCSFDVGDDAICLKSGKNQEGRELGKPCEKVIIRNCIIYHGHGGVVVGSEMSGGVRDVYVDHCTFIGTDIGIRFKSLRGRGGIVERITMTNIRMKDIAREAISIHLFYEGREGSGKPLDDWMPVSEETPQFRDIIISGILCSGADTAIYAGGLPEMPLKDITISSSTFHSRQGAWLSNCNGFGLEDVDMHIEAGSLININQCQAIDIIGLKGCDKEKNLRQITVRGSRSAAITCRRTSPERLMVIVEDEAEAEAVQFVK